LPLVFINEQNLVGISAVMLVIFYSCLRICTTCHSPLYDNTIASTKLEILNVSQSH